MTLLTTEQLLKIPHALDEFDAELTLKTGLDLRGLAMRALSIDEHAITANNNKDFVCVPVSSGGGVIDGFSDAVASIINHIGFNARVANMDMEGFSDAVSRGEVVFVADDSRFIAIDFKSGYLADNATATGIGFACATELIAGRAGIPREVLVLGLGRVGKAAARWFTGRGWDVYAHDPGVPPTDGGICYVSSIGEGLRSVRAVLDATPSAGILGVEDVSTDMVYVCPGVPCGLSDAAKKTVRQESCLYDPLRIGVASMATALAYGVDMDRLARGNSGV